MNASPVNLNRIKRALISVSDKHNIIELASELKKHKVEILATGNTAKILLENNIPVTLVSDYTQAKEIFNGRVKTLHPKIFGGILARLDKDQQELTENDISVIDLVIVNLYPFQETVNNPNSNFEQKIENIDIGGPSLIRAAAKNHAWCTVLTSPTDYAKFCLELSNNDGQVSFDFRKKMAAKAFIHTAQYDSAIAEFFNPDQKFLCLTKTQKLRYGENPHQAASFYLPLDSKLRMAFGATKIQGKELSYNNILDTDTALNLVKEFDRPSCVIVKHANPCGVASSSNLLASYKLALACDPESAFGGIIAFNQKVTSEIIEHIFANQFAEIIIAPEFCDTSINLAKQKPNLRLLSYDPLEINHNSKWSEYKTAGGGLLAQENSSNLIKSENLEIVTQTKPTNEQINDLLFAAKVAGSVKSNAIVYAKSMQTIGIGAGQTSRIFSAKIAAIRAQDNNLELSGAVMASDAFFPFKDSIIEAHKRGIKAIIQPGGSMRDQEVIDEANRLGIAMVFTGIRQFRH